MKSELVVVFSLLAMAHVNVPAASRLFCDFSRGIPAEFVLVDADRNQPSTGAKKFGFSVGTPWLAYYDETERNYVAQSTSWYTPSGTSDDWMILPPVDTHEGTVLEWRSRAVDAKYRDGLTVYVLPAQTADDSAEPLLTIDEENYAWTAHSLDLSTYAGQSVCIAFVNHSANKSRLYVDDIFVGVRQPLVITPTAPFVVKPGESFAPTYTLSSETGADLSDVTVTCTAASAQGSVSVGSADSLQIATPGDSLVLTYHATGTAGDVTVTHTVEAHRRRIVCEEITGTWCGYCVRGIVHMHHAREQYPDDFIGIAVHSGDVMALSDYRASVVAPGSSSGLPHAIVNRDLEMEIDPALIETAFLYAREQPITAALELQVAVSEADSLITANWTARFNESTDQERYRVGFVLVEDSVHHPELPQDYRQHNAYYGGQEGAMGGFELLPEYVSADEMYYMDVPRAVYGGVTGLEGSLPAGIDAGRHYSACHELRISANVDRLSQLRLVALLLDVRRGVIVNAAQVALRPMVAPDDAGANSMNGTFMSEPCGKPATMHCYDLQGRRIADSPVGKLLIQNGRKMAVGCRSMSR